MGDENSKPVQTLDANTFGPVSILRVKVRGGMNAGVVTLITIENL
jgi:hypothetical protein